MAQTMNGSRRTERQLKYFQARADGMTQREAARQAGYCVNGGTIHTLEQCMKSYLGEALQQQDITPDLLARRMREGLNATTVRAFKSGKGILEQAYPDYGTRLRYLELAATLLGLHPDSQSSSATAQGERSNISQLIENYEHLSDKELLERMQRLLLNLPTK